jgi:membrane associated rhomboid family serine protease
MFIPYTVDVPMARLPVANWVLIAITTLLSFAVFVGAFAPPDRQREQEMVWDRFKNQEPEDFDEYLAALERQQRLPPLALGRSAFSFSQLFTYVFVHADIFHLVGNMIFLFVFGNAVNAKLGHGLFVVFYFLFGALAGIAWLVLSSGGGALVGASGAIMGLVGMFLAFYPRNDVQVFYMFTLVWTGQFRIASGLLIAFYMVLDLLGAFFGGGGAVAYVSHVVGCLAGLALAVALLNFRWAKADEGEETLLQVLGWHKKNKSRQDEYWDAKKKAQKKKRSLRDAP